jgi:hypothetical protein
MRSLAWLDARKAIFSSNSIQEISREYSFNIRTVVSWKPARGHLTSLSSACGNGNKAGKRWVEKAAGNETTSRSPGLR